MCSLPSELTDHTAVIWRKRRGSSTPSSSSYQYQLLWKLRLKLLTNPWLHNDKAQKDWFPTCYSSHSFKTPGYSESVIRLEKRKFQSHSRTTYNYSIEFWHLKTSGCILRSRLQNKRPCFCTTFLKIPLNWNLIPRQTCNQTSGEIWPMSGNKLTVNPCYSYFH